MLYGSRGAKQASLEALETQDQRQLDNSDMAESVRQDVKRARDEDLLRKLEQRKIQRESLLESRKQFQTSQQYGEFNKEKFEEREKQQQNPNQNVDYEKRWSYQAKNQLGLPNRPHLAAVISDDNED